MGSGPGGLSAGREAPTGPTTGPSRQGRGGTCRWCWGPQARPPLYGPAGRAPLPGDVTRHRPPQDQAGGGLQGRGPIRPCPPEMGASGSQPGQRGKPMGQVGCPLGPALLGRTPSQPPGLGRPLPPPGASSRRPSCTRQRTECSVPGGKPGVGVRARAFSLWNRRGSQPAGGSTAPRPKWGQNRAGGGPESPPRRRAGEEGTGKASGRGRPHMLVLGAGGQLWGAWVASDTPGGGQSPPLHSSWALGAGLRQTWEGPVLDP